MNAIHQKIVDAVLEKAKCECPEALDMIGIYGSVCTGDVHERSDLDLLILINDPKGYVLSKAFILEDEGIGYDIYCTNWEMLEEDANCGHAHISKLMDCEVVYVRDESVTERLESLKNQAREVLSADKRFEVIAGIREELCKIYGHAFVAETIGQLRNWAAYMITRSLDAVMLWNGAYFKRGVKRTFEELDGLDIPDDFETNVMKIVQAKNFIELGIALGTLFKSVMRFTERRTRKDAPTKERLAGTYEEMFSNWRNKMPEAGERGDAFASFMNLASLQYMFEEIRAESAIPRFQVMEEFDAGDLAKNAKIFDDALEDYRQEYVKLGMEPVRYASVDEFVKAYLK
ncbi:MAG: nucleotidyltransferase domain-containing protein [Lachnospiraceae bacterium]|nr:nucleotidyltransferase domain-containing protein [Lachnospiraceae bacterium]